MNEPPINPREREYRGWKPEPDYIPPVVPSTPETQTVDPKAKAFGLVSFVIGVVALLFPFVIINILFTTIFILGLAVIGLIFGILARKGGARGFATAGLVINIIICIFYPITIYGLLTGMVDLSSLGL